MTRLVMAFAVLVAAFGISGCVTTSGGKGAELASPGHGGGTALFASGERVTIGKEGDVTDRCYVCGVTESSIEACKIDAERKGLAMCATGAVEAEALARFKALQNDSAPRGTLICMAYFLNPPPGHYGTLAYRGDLCQMTSQFTCFCVVP